MVEGLTGGGEVGLAHLSYSAATGCTAPRPRRSAHLICPILRVVAQQLRKSREF